MADHGFAMHRVFSYLDKPIDNETLLAYARRAINFRDLFRENQRLAINLRRYDDELSLRNRELWAISRVAAITNDKDDFISQVDEALTVVCESLRADAALIYHAPISNGEMVMRSQIGLSEEDQKRLMALDSTKGLLGTVGAERRLYFTADQQQMPIGYLLESGAPVLIQGFSGFLGAPLFSTGKLIGALLAGYRNPEAEVGDNEKILMASLARQLSITMENALLSEVASVDALTNLYSRGFFETRLEEEIGRAKRHGHEMVLCMMDVDHFKSINDTYGHTVGDHVLRGVSHSLRASIRNSDIAARYGGEEMAVVLPETGKGGGQVVAEKIRRTIEEMKIPVSGSDEEDGALGVTLSIGMACFPVHGKSPEDMIKIADEALYRAKDKGRNQVVAV
ncbi:MAG: diguanylate cyclase [bacterium]|nr:diguanylate cyclase [bacterium]